MLAVSGETSPVEIDSASAAWSKDYSWALLLENDSQLRQDGFVDKHRKPVKLERAGMAVEARHDEGWAA